MQTINWLIQSLKPILDNINQPVTAIDKNGYFVYYNLASARMDGTVPDDVIGQHLLAINQWLDPEQSTLLQCLRDKKQITNSHQTYQVIGGQQTHYIHSVTPLFDSEGELIGAIEIGRTVQETPDVPASAYSRPEIPNIITCDPFLLDEINKLTIFAETDLPIIIYGETGTGKELFAKRAHALSGRFARPMMSLNCAAIPETLLESTLFGTVRGAFTGAETRKGLFSLANGGTLFLDEINSMPISLQSKLLRVLQDGSYMALGAQTQEYSNVRLITAMNQEPYEAINEGKLREDFYYRLNTGEIIIPPLRTRPHDIILLAQNFVAQFAPKLRPEVTMLDSDSFAVLTRHHWPGNVRELQNVISRSLLLHKNGSKLKDMILTRRPPTEKIATQGNHQSAHLPTRLKDEESALIKAMLQKHQGNISQAARELGVPRTTLNAKLKKLGIAFER